jgi:REP element-mobilizing transposase RayT
MWLGESGAREDKSLFLAFVAQGCEAPLPGASGKTPPKAKLQTFYTIFTLTQFLLTMPAAPARVSRAMLKQKRQHRIKARETDADGIYHCISRTVDGQQILNNDAKEMLRKNLHQVAEFSGVQVITYAMMSNHFHVLVRVLKQEPVPDAELLRRYKVLYPKPTKWATAQINILETMLKTGGKDASELRERLLKRMNNISEFMKTFKHRFSVWFNKSHNRFGPVWSERFTSTLVQSNHRFGLQMMAAYIDLNPVRAGLVKDPKDYRFCGYGEAEATRDAKLIRGLRFTMDAEGQFLDTDAKVLASYRISLFGKGATAKHGDPNAARISAEDFDKMERAGGRLTGVQRLRLRMSWFTRGAVIGSETFVTEHLVEYRQRTRRREHISPRGFSGMESGGWEDLYALRARI